MSAIGNTFTLPTPTDKNARLFEIDKPSTLIECFATLRYLAIKRKGIYVQILSKDKYKFAVVRSAYFCWIKEHLNSAKGNGETVQELHEQLKASYLLPILCREDQEFADLVQRETKDGITSKIVLRLLSIADSSITTSKIMKEYFTQCQRGME